VGTGSKYSFIYSSALSYGTLTSSISGITTTLLDPTMLINQTVKLEDIAIPEFSALMNITKLFRAYVAQAQATSFDVIHKILTSV
jgi:hypothetical protein